MNSGEAIKAGWNWYELARVYAGVKEIFGVAWGNPVIDLALEWRAQTNDPSLCEDPKTRTKCMNDVHLVWQATDSWARFYGKVGMYAWLLLFIAYPTFVLWSKGKNPMRDYIIVAIISFVACASMTAAHAWLCFKSPVYGKTEQHCVALVAMALYTLLFVTMWHMLPTPDDLVAKSINAFLKNQKGHDEDRAIERKEIAKRIDGIDSMLVSLLENNNGSSMLMSATTATKRVR
jgi:hypothetical protein